MPVKEPDGELLRLLVENVTDYAIFVLDAEGNVASWNPGAARIKGYAAEEILGRHFSIFYPQEALDRGWPAHELEVASARGRFEDEGWRLRKDGSRFWANVVITALRDEAGHLRGYAKITRDLTARRDAEENRRLLGEETAARAAAYAERERLRVTMASIGDAVITTDAQGRVEFLNPVAEQLVGWSAEAAVGRELDEVFCIVNEDTRRPVENPAMRALREGTIVGLANHTVLISRQGAERPIDDSAAPIRTGQGEIAGSVLVFRDISDRKRAERHRNVRQAVTLALSLATTAAEGAAGVLDAICEHLAWDAGQLWLLDPDGSALVLHTRRHRRGTSPPEESIGRAVRTGEGVPGIVWATGEPAQRSDDAHATFACPVRVDQRFVGVIELVAHRAAALGPELLETMATVAATLAQFLDRRRAEERLREQATTAETLLRVSRLLAQELDLQRIVQMVTDESTRLCGAQFGAFFYNVVSERGEAYTLYTLSGAPREAFEGFPMPRNTAVFGPTFRGEGVVRLDDVTRDPRYGKSAPYHGMPAGHPPVRSYLAVPVVSRAGEVLGGLFFGHSKPGVFTPSHERLVVGTAAQAAVAIDSAMLYQRTQATAERLNLALTAADLGDWSWDAASDVVTLSDRAGEIFGIPPGPAPTWAAMQALLHEDDRDRARREVERVIAERAQYDIEYRVLRPDGSYAWVGVLGRAVYDGAGPVVRMYGIVQDISDRKRAEADRARAETVGEAQRRTLELLVHGAGLPDVLDALCEVIETNAEDRVRATVWLADHDGEHRRAGRREPSDGSGGSSWTTPIRSSRGTVLGTFEVHHPTPRAPTDEERRLVDILASTASVAIERRRDELALRNSEERLRLALDAGRMGVWDWNVRTGALDWSDTLEPLHGLAPGTFGGTLADFQELIHPDDRPAVAAAIQRALDGEEEFYVEFRNLRPTGAIHWIAGSGKVFNGDDGKPLRMIGIGLDVTRRKRAEQTARFLADASAALAALVDFDSTLQKVASLAVPHFADWVSVDVVNDEGALRRVGVAHVDPAKLALAGELHRRFPPDPAAPSGAWNIIRTGQPEIIPVITDDMLVAAIDDDELLGIMRALGLRSYIGVPLVVRGKTMGALTFIVAESGVVYDATDLAIATDLANRAAIAVENAQLYRELREADRRKDEFLATLAHELRNPLAPIQTGLHVLRLSGGGGETATDARTMMERQLTHMVRLVDDLMDVSRITRNRLELRKERVSLATVIHAAIETSRPLIESAGHVLTVDVAPAPVHLDADPVRLAQVFSNLLNNAAKYTEPGGSIAVTAEAIGDEAVVRVRDDGLGIPAEALPRIFEMFSQVDRNMVRAQGGLGIGLTLVRRLTELHGGRVTVASEGPGRGSEFTVRIPLPPRDEASAGAGALEAEAAAGARRRVLVVDDNCDAADTLAMLLDLMGNDVRTAHDGLAAVDVAEEYRPDLILLDIGLPSIDGYEACRRIRSRPWAQGIVIVALTGWGQDDDRRKSKEAGFDHHLVKPVEVDYLTKLLGSP